MFEKMSAAEKNAGSGELKRNSVWLSARKGKIRLVNILIKIPVKIPEFKKSTLINGKYSINDYL
jgi:hypothetical protein